MNAIEILTADHREVERLFGEFEQFGKRAYRGRARVVAKIIKALEIHAALEETIFYPAVRSVDVDLVLESYEEHHVLKLLIAEIKELPPEDERYVAKVTVLMDIVAHHVEEEEEDLFPNVEESCGSRVLEELGQKLEDARPTIGHRIASEPQLRITFMAETPAVTKSRR